MSGDKVIKYNVYEFCARSILYLLCSQLQLYEKMHKFNVPAVKAIKIRVGEVEHTGEMIMSIFLLDY